MLAGLGTVALAAHTIVKQIVDFCLGLLGTFSTVAQTLVASCLGKVQTRPLPAKSQGRPLYLLNSASHPQFCQLPRFMPGARCHNGHESEKTRF